MNLLQLRRQILELRRARDAAMVMKAACLARDAASGSPVPLRPAAPAEAELNAMAAAPLAADVDDSEAPASSPATPSAPGEGSAPSLAAAVEGSLLELVHTLQAERLQVREWGRERATRRGPARARWHTQSSVGASRWQHCIEGHASYCGATCTQARAEKALVARVNAALRARLPTAEGPEQEAEPLDDVGYVVHTLPALTADAAQQANELRNLSKRVVMMAEEQVRA
jgi:hypothetical protein